MDIDYSKLHTSNAIWPIQKTLDSKFNQRVTGLDYYILDNGLRVVQMRDAADRSFFVKAYVNAGAVHQPVTKRGLAHFVEHMVFKGTKNIGDKKQLDDFAQDYNISYNAHTSDYYQGFYAVSDSDLESAHAASKLVSDILFHPQIPPEEIDLEREVILAERNMRNADPDSVAYEILSQHYLDDTNPLGQGSILGWAEDIKSIAYKDVVDFHQNYFAPENMVLVCASGLHRRQMRKIITEHFEQVQNSGRGWHNNPILNQPRRTKAQNYQSEKDYENIYLFVNYYFPKTQFQFPDIELFQLNIVQYVLANRLFQDLRDDQGLAYSVWANNMGWGHGLTLTLRAEFPRQRYAVAKPQLENYVLKLADIPITKQEFKRAMRNKKSTRWANGARPVAVDIAHGLFIHGQFMSPEFSEDYYNRISLSDVHKFVEKHIINATPEVVAVGPKE